MIIEGYITIDNEYDNMPRINNESICSYLEKLITNERYHKRLRDIVNGFTSRPRLLLQPNKRIILLENNQRKIAKNWL